MLSHSILPQSFINQLEDDNATFFSLTDTKARTLLTVLQNRISSTKSLSAWIKLEPPSLREAQILINHQLAEQEPEIYWLQCIVKNEEQHKHEMLVAWTKWDANDGKFHDGQHKWPLEVKEEEKNPSSRLQLEMTTYLEKNNLYSECQITPANLFETLKKVSLNSWTVKSLINIGKILTHEGRFSDAIACFDCIEGNKVSEYYASRFELAETIFTQTYSDDTSLYETPRDHARLVFSQLHLARQLKNTDSFTNLLTRTFQCLCNGNYQSYDEPIPNLMLPPKKKLSDFLLENTLPALLMIADSAYATNQKLGGLEKEIAALRIELANLHAKNQFLKENASTVEHSTMRPNLFQC